MKFTVGSQQLSSRLSIISRVVPSSSKTGGTSAIINDILFEIKGDILRMTGTDGETRLTLSLRTQTHEGEDYTICIRPEHLLLPLKELPAQDLTFDIDTDNQHINVRYNNGHFDFVGQDASNYPDVAALEEFTLPGKPVSLIKLLFTHRSPGTTSDVEGAEGATEETAPTLEDTIRVTVYANYATFEREDMRLQCRLLDGKYPNCESVIPQDNDKSIIADRSQLLAAFRRVSIFANDATKLILSILPGNDVELLLGDRAHAAIITPQERDEDETIIAVDMPLLI